MDFTYEIAKVTRIIDGDTMEVSLDLGFRTWHHGKLRIKDLDTYETTRRYRNRSKVTVAEVEKGREAQLHAHLLMAENIEIKIVTHKIDVYGRTLATIYFRDKHNGEDDLNPWTNYSDHMKAMHFDRRLNPL